MSVDRVKAYLEQWNRGEDVLEFPVSSATVQLAAEALHVIPARIAKTLSFKGKEKGAILIVTAGDAKNRQRQIQGFFWYEGKNVELGGGYFLYGTCNWRGMPFCDRE